MRIFILGWLLVTGLFAIDVSKITVNTNKAAFVIVGDLVIYDIYNRSYDGPLSNKNDGLFIAMYEDTMVKSACKTKEVIELLKIGKKIVINTHGDKYGVVLYIDKCPADK